MEESAIKSFAGIITILLAAGVTLLLLPGPVDGHRGMTAITNARLFDGEQVIENATLLIADGRITEAGGNVSVPKAAAVPDGAGKTILTGLIDAHVHDYGSARTDALRMGVTTLLDMFRLPTDQSLVIQQRESFRIRERVTGRLDGTVFLIEGRGTRTTAGGEDVVTHDAIGLLSWDPANKRYNFRTHDLRGQARDATLELDQDGRMRWGFRDENSNALLRFEMHVEDDTWHQTGRISPDDGDNRYPMLEMTLNRQAPTRERACP